MARNQGLEHLDIGAYPWDNVSSPRSAVNTSEGLIATKERPDMNLTASHPTWLDIDARDDIESSAVALRMICAWRGPDRPRVKVHMDGAGPEWFVHAFVVEDRCEQPGELAHLIRIGALKPDSWQGYPGYRLLATWLLNPYRTQRPIIDQATRELVFERDDNMCLSCGATEQLSLDHVYPYSLGGTDDEGNLQTLCVSCNSRKGASV